MTTIGLVAPGDMGAGIGGALVANGAEVWTLLQGRSEATLARAKAAGMQGVSEQDLVKAEFILSVLPPGEAIAFAERMVPALTTAVRKPVFVECNPVDPQKIRKMEAMIVATGTPFVDGGIVGSPPRPGNLGPMIFLAGKDAGRVEALKKHALRVQNIDAPVGAASALKLSYAAITKGLFAIASAAILGATRAGVAEVLYAEFSANQAAVLKNITYGIGGMGSKTGRWIDEMNEISAYLGSERIEGDLYRNIARFYGHLTSDHEGDQTEAKQLAAFFAYGKADAGTQKPAATAPRSGSTAKVVSAAS